jgi:perosamine synthetase
MIRGPQLAEYERAFARRLGVGYAFSFSAGRVGFYGILQALGIGPGHEVMLQVPTHIVVANAIRYVGARPVYVDCRLDTYNIDLEHAERLLTPRTRALVLQHTFGIPADPDAALAFARRHGLELIEDCVHSLGARYDGREVGTFGRAAFFSTEETKTISTTMGGMVATDDSELARQLQTFQAACQWPSRWLTARYLAKLAVYQALTEPRVHRFARKAYDRIGERHPLPRPTTADERRGERPPGFEQRLANAQAELGLRQLRRLDANLAHRRAVAEAYRARLSGPAFRLPEAAENAQPAFVRYPVWVESRSAAMRALAPYAVPGTWFTSPLEEADSPAAGGYEAGTCPNAELAATHLINLPTHPRVNASDVEAIVSALEAVAEVRDSDKEDRPAPPSP